MVSFMTSLVTLNGKDLSYAWMKWGEGDQAFI